MGSLCTKRWKAILHVILLKLQSATGWFCCFAWVVCLHCLKLNGYCTACIPNKPEPQPLHISEFNSLDSKPSENLDFDLSSFLSTILEKFHICTKGLDTLIIPKPLRICLWPRRWSKEHMGFCALHKRNWAGPGCGQSTGWWWHHCRCWAGPIGYWWGLLVKWEVQVEWQVCAVS